VEQDVARGPPASWAFKLWLAVGDASGSPFLAPPALLLSFFFRSFLTTLTTRYKPKLQTGTPPSKAPKSQQEERMPTFVIVQCYRSGLSAG
jgi:hypothetical protein